MFKGIFCPSITITDDEGKIDYDLWGKHLDHLADAGVNGVLLFGSIGEFYSVSLADKEAALEFAVKRVGERMKVFAGVGDTTYANVIEFTKFAEKAGADAVLAVSPYYFGPSPLTAENYFGGIAEATKLPVILYNFPARTGTDLTPELVASLAAKHPNICHTRKVIRAARAVNPEFTVFSGFDEYYLVNRVSGGNGVLCGLTNVEPETFVKMHAAYEEGDFATAVACAERISKLMAVYDVCDLFVSAIKAAVKVKGLPISTKIFEPAVQATEANEAAIAELLAE